MKKKTYSAPLIRSEAIQVGVFGSYGSVAPPAFGLFKIKKPKRRRGRHW